ncbi:MAG: low molecular weight protein arginine phosphatase [Ruminococcaceae bacterium]|nr:low molecular weight protein arginine phosphatase [Oscillospiraceae bacterium]
MNILFVCTGNTCRSPMAAVLMNQLAMEKNLDVRIESAGIYAQEGAPATEGAILAMQAYGIDLSGHRAKQITSELLTQCDLILTMTSAHKAALSGIENCYTLSEYAGFSGEIADPFGGSAEVYRVCAGQIFEAVKRVAERIEHSE